MSAPLVVKLPVAIDDVRRDMRAVLVLAGFAAHAGDDEDAARFYTAVAAAHAHLAKGATFEAYRELSKVQGVDIVGVTIGQVSL